MYRLNVNNEFNQRTRSVFDSLETLEVKHKTKQTEYVATGSEETQEEECDEIKANDFVFKVPEVPKRLSETNDYNAAKKKKSRPDYEVNPDKWKKYSLEDTKEHSNSANFMAALSFINRQHMIAEEEEINEEKIEFNKPIGKKMKQKESLSVEEEEEEQSDETVKEVAKTETSVFKRANKNRLKKAGRKRDTEEEVEEDLSKEKQASDIELKEVDSDTSSQESDSDQVDINNYLD